jgi:hypothetical protein
MDLAVLCGAERKREPPRYAELILRQCRIV